MIVNARIVRYARDHPLRIWHKGDVSAVKVRSASYCCNEMRELWNLKAVSLNGKTGKIWLYMINPYDIDYGSEAEMMECKFCPACGQEIRIVNEDSTGMGFEFSRWQAI